MDKKTGYTVVEEKDENIEGMLAEHHKTKVKRFIWAMVVVLVLVAIGEIWIEVKSFDDYEVRNTVEQGDKSAAKFASFKGKILEYSNDGAVYMSADGTYIWNQAFEMTNPSMDICDNYLALFDIGGTEVYIMKTDGLLKKIDISMPIRTVCIAEQGTVAVLMEKDSNYYVQLYNTNGEELAGGEYFIDQGCIPVDIALSDDAKDLAVDMVDVSDGRIDTTISFYNFGSVGQNEVNNSVGSYTYKNTMVPEIEYVADNKMIALGDKKVRIFSGQDKPKLATEIKLDNEVDSFFYNNKYIGLSYSNEEEEGYHIMAYDMKGNVVTECDTNIAYTSIEFLSNDNICITNDTECEIYTVHSIKKFSYTFEDTTLYKVMYEGGITNYIFITEGKLEEVRLK